ncbi:hypothetical protein IFM89_037723 [Coptis chinensis]|uniref:Pentatricopeptide repeat-containing protein n=1 Tax=Coptis chinensis TaxID=261450 RepID=A0A835IUZ1_9MAGN|nr:hypothetical protein IFM89_037723 [Coptis chinensis]
MRIEYDLIPELYQYACMVNLYGKTGQLTKAKKTMDEMPFEPNVVMLSSFLDSCRVYGEVQLRREAANQLFKMDPCSVAPYVTLANIYAEDGMWNEVRQVRRTMREKGIRKSTGLSWIEVEKKFHVFLVSDTSHPQLLDIYAELDMLTMAAMEARYMPRMKEDHTND